MTLRRSASTLIVLAFASAFATRACPQALDHALLRAIRARDDRRVESLLRQGTPAAVRGGDGTSALMVASLWGTPRSVRLLLEHGADPDAANARGVTALHWAARDIEKTRLLVEAGADVHARNEAGRTPLFVAASFPGNDGVVQYLSSRGALPHAKARDGKTPLHRAVRARSLASVASISESCRANGTLDSLSDDDWRDLLLDAALRGDVPILERLWELLPKKDLLNHEGGPLPIHGALVGQHVEAAHWLLDHGARVDLSLQDGSLVDTLLLSTFFDDGDVSVARAVLDRGASTEVVNELGESALTWARRRGNHELVELLREAGAPDRPDEAPTIPNRDIRVHAGNRQRVLRETIEGSLALLLRSSDTFLERRTGCESCHHQFLPGMAAGYARDRGIPVDESSVERLLSRHVRSWSDELTDVHEQASSFSVHRVAWGLWSLGALGYPRTLLTDSYVRSLLDTQGPSGTWSTPLTRPPLGGGEAQATALAIQALRSYPVQGLETEIDVSVRRAVAWLRAHRPRAHEDRVFRLLGLLWAGESESAWAEDARTLVEAQQEDGGWSQFPGLASDAWATGETLFALSTSGAVPPRDPVYERGVDFLLRTRFDDGSWFVKRRAFPLQVQFDSGFPFERDQWISASATAWAVMALTRAVEPATAIVVPAWSEASAATIDTTRTDAAEKEPASTTEGDETVAASPDHGDAAATPRTTTPSRAIGFAEDIAPILARSCAACHSGSLPEGELDVTRRGALLQGGASGEPAVVPGSSARSRLLRAVTSTDESERMPPRDERARFPLLDPKEIEALRNWIEQGASWPEGARVDAH